MAAAEPGQLEFRGESSMECEAFINAVSRQALSIGRQRDDQWLADFASSCITYDALRWWDTLDDQTQGSWKLLRKAMLARYCPLFHGGSGEEAEKFVRMVRQRALDEGKLNDNIWIAGFASACFAGDALRWHASLEPSVQIDWIKLQQALLARYPRESQETLPKLVPTPAAAVPTLDRGTSASKSSRSGRIRVIKDGVPIKYYIDSSQMPGGYIRLTIFESEAMALEWDWSSDDVQALCIRGKTHRREAIGVQWDGSGGGDLVIVRRDSGTGLPFSSAGVLQGWKISEPTSFGSPGFDLTPIDKTGKTLYVQLDLFQKVTLVSTKPAFNSLSLSLEPL